jgi:TRAP-type mannitol/chloroaromatic compound transport system substrate-binding protein
MKRRDFLAATAGLAATASLPSAAIAQAATPIRWRMVTTWPKNFPGLGTGAERLARRIEQTSGGRIEIKVYAGGELVPPLEAFDAVAQGTAEMGHGAAYYWQGKSKATNFFAAVPFGLTATELSAWLRYGGGQELWDEVYGNFGLKGFAAGNTGAQMGGWFAREIYSAEDLKGLKMRIPGLGGEVMRRLGVAAVLLPGAEIFPALQSGTIDATEWVGPWNDLAFGFHKVAKFYYWPGFHEPGSGIECFINKEKFEALPDDLRAIIATACEAETYEMLAEFTARNADALKILTERHGVKLRHFPNDVIRAMGRASKEVYAELRNADPLTAKVAHSYLNFRDKVMDWSRISDQGYMEMRELALKE